MNLELDPAIRDDYDERGKFVVHRGKKRYQPSLYRLAVLEWARANLACPRCGATALTEHWHNLADARDLANVACESCGCEYLLLIGSRPMRGAARCSNYKALIAHIEAGSAPDVICIAYDRDAYRIRDAFMVPGRILAPEFVVPPLGPLPEEHDIWCDIHVGRMAHVLGANAVVDIVTACHCWR